MQAAEAAAVQSVKLLEEANIDINGASPKQIVVIQWESLEKAQAYFESEAYKQLVPIRDRSANFRAFVIEGLAQ